MKYFIVANIWKMSSTNLKSFNSKWYVVYSRLGLIVLMAYFVHIYCGQQMQ